MYRDGVATLRLDVRQKALVALDQNALFERFALQAARAGRPFGAKLLAERVRWEHFIGSKRGHEYKLNNNHTAYIARRLVKDHPQLGAFLRFRAAKH